MIEFMDRQALILVITSARRMTGAEIETPKCLGCQHFERGRCKSWDHILPVDFWKVGCDRFDMFIPF